MELIKALNKDPLVFERGVILVAVLLAVFMLEKFFPSTKRVCDVVEMLLAAGLWLGLVKAIGIEESLFWWLVLLTAFLVILAFDAGRSIGSHKKAEPGGEETGDEEDSNQ